MDFKQYLLDQIMKIFIFCFHISQRFHLVRGDHLEDLQLETLSS